MRDKKIILGTSLDEWLFMVIILVATCPPQAAGRRKTAVFLLCNLTHKLAENIKNLL